ncbi:hypothetical protein IMSAG250_01166 [Clostridiales bacterium]|nr:hypothetical protein IMSAG250_01166 [Clostridiales bacterium]
MLISPAAFTAVGSNKPLCFTHIRHNSTAVYFLYNCSSRYTDFKAFAVFSMALSTLSGQTVFSCILALVSEIGECCKIIINNKNNIAALTAVTAVRTACCNIFFTMKGNCTGAAVACLNFYFSYIYKHYFSSLFQ